LPDMLLRQIKLAVVEKDAPAPEEEHGTTDKTLLNVIGHLDDFAQIVGAMGDVSLNTQFDVSN